MIITNLFQNAIYFIFDTLMLTTAHVCCADMHVYADAVGGLGRSQGVDRSLYPYFFNKDEAVGIVQRLLAEGLT